MRRKWEWLNEEDQPRGTMNGGEVCDEGGLAVEAVGRVMAMDLDTGGGLVYPHYPLHPSIHPSCLDLDGAHGGRGT